MKYTELYIRVYIRIFDKIMIGLIYLINSGEALYYFPVIFQTQIYTDLHGFDFDQILSITNLMESYDIDHNNLKSV